ncbi:non-selective voltage-gated ion channel VDAC2-like [Styela clava]|uniref:voltage-dependent anion-selective channel protein 2-like n=1 Tax=Styela clava TaxID=7725 RepID=UPI00193ADE78|nr:voltage-dependent anion-selective channel protein 2-like [Styela clava]
MSKVPPTYGDLGKSARDLFDKGYNYGFAKVDLKTKSSSGVEFTTKGSSAHASGKIGGTLETKYKRPAQGLTFTEKWSTDNTLGTEVAIEDQLATGLKITFCTSFSPPTGKKSGCLKTAYKRDYLHMNLDTDFNFAGPTLQGSSVVGYEGWLGGYQFAFDTSKSKLTKSNFALGYTGSDFQLLTTANDGSEFAGSIFQSVNKDLSTGVQLSWTSGQSSTRFGVAAKYNWDKDATINAKVNNAGQVGLGWTHKLREGVKLTLSSLIDGKNFNSGGHQLGLGLEFEV